MTVQELLKSVNREEFIKYYIGYCGYPRSAQKKKLVGTFYDELVTYPAAIDSSMIVFAIPSFDSDLLDSFLINRSDLKKWGRIETYSYETTCAQKILGYSVSESCRHYLRDDIRYAAGIFYELSYFGYTLSIQNTEASSFLDDITKSVKEIEDGSAKLIPAEEIFEKLGYTDTRTEEEKKFDIKEAKLHSKFINKLKTELYKLELTY